MRTLANIVDKCVFSFSVKSSAQSSLYVKIESIKKAISRNNILLSLMWIMSHGFIIKSRQQGLMKVGDATET